jgi:hypothetical protein
MKVCFFISLRLLRNLSAASLLFNLWLFALTPFKEQKIIHLKDYCIELKKENGMFSVFVNEAQVPIYFCYDARDEKRQDCRIGIIFDEQDRLVYLYY